MPFVCVAKSLDLGGRVVLALIGHLHINSILMAIDVSKEALSRVIHGLFPTRSNPVPQLPDSLTLAQSNPALARVKHVDFALR